MPIAIYSHEHGVKYVVHSRLSSAYFCFIAYNISLFLVPLIITLTTPVPRGVIVDAYQPDLNLTGAWYVSVGNYETSSLKPISGIDVSFGAVDVNQDAVTDKISIQLNSTRLAVASSIHFVIEVKSSDGHMGIIRGKLSAAVPSNRISAWYSLECTSTSDPVSESFKDILTRSGSSDLIKLAAAESKFSLSSRGFQSIESLESGSTALQASITIEVVRSIRLRQSGEGEIFRMNFIYFISVFLFNFVIMRALFGALVTGRAITTRLFTSADKDR